MSLTSKTVQTSKAMRFSFFFAAALVALAAIPLFLFSERTDEFFAWTIQPPLTAAFLGAGYWAVTMAAILAIQQREWTKVRIVLPVVISGVTLILLATLLHLDRFHLASPIFTAKLEAWAWLVLYVALVPLIIWGVWQQRREAGIELPRQTSLPAWLRLLMVITGTVMVLLGIGLFLFPLEVSSALWSWTLTPLTGRMTGAWLVAIGISLLIGVWENDYHRLYIAAAAYITYPLLQGINLLRYSATPQWSSPQLWLLLLILVSLLITGISIMRGYLRSRT
ncbi:MAG: hypothetical protein KF726_13940 [Anaerolineae bacterium]|nr:hypothetical protein [Anaerolineae bacterium]